VFDVVVLAINLRTQKIQVFVHLIFVEHLAHLGHELTFLDVALEFLQFDYVFLGRVTVVRLLAFQHFDIAVGDSLRPLQA
jgi:hypothetical protein